MREYPKGSKLGVDVVVQELVDNKAVTLKRINAAPDNLYPVVVVPTGREVRVAFKGVVFGPSGTRLPVTRYGGTFIFPTFNFYGQRQSHVKGLVKGRFPQGGQTYVVTVNLAEGDQANFSFFARGLGGEELQEAPLVISAARVADIDEPTSSEQELIDSIVEAAASLRRKLSEQR